MSSPCDSVLRSTLHLGPLFCASAAAHLGSQVLGGQYVAVKTIHFTDKRIERADVVDIALRLIVSVILASAADVLAGGKQYATEPQLNLWADTALFLRKWDCGSAQRVLMLSIKERMLVGSLLPQDAFVLGLVIDSPDLCYPALRSPTGQLPRIEVTTIPFHVWQRVELRYLYALARVQRYHGDSHDFGELFAEALHDLDKEPDKSERVRSGEDADI